MPTFHVLDEHKSLGALIDALDAQERTLALEARAAKACQRLHREVVYASMDEQAIDRGTGWGYAAEVTANLAQLLGEAERILRECPSPLGVAPYEPRYPRLDWRGDWTWVAA